MKTEAKCPGFALLFVFAAWLVLGPSSTQAGTLEWVLGDTTCVPPSDALVVPCGTFGTFVFGDGAQVSCSEAPGNVETPNEYPRPKVVFPTRDLETQNPDPHFPLASDGQGALEGRHNLENVSARAEDYIPCAEGSCLSAPGGSNGQEPWIPIIDWNDWHGWTTAWTVHQLSRLPVNLIALDSPEVVGKLGLGVGDAHVIAALCKVAQATVSPTNAPTPPIVNMSFGRLPEATENDGGDSCLEEELTCQLRRLLDHLRSSGTQPVASAGNHGESLFPASYESVLSTGSLDLAAFRRDGLAVPSWESPSEVNALMPSSGLCLSKDVDSDQQSGDSLWPAPAGTSYSSALLAGWMAPILLEGRVQDPLLHNWVPSWSTESLCFQLGEDTLQRCNPQANLVLERILGKVPNNCWNHGIQEPALVVTEVGEPILGLPPELMSQDQWIKMEHNPAPQSHTCVPCVSSGGDYSLAPRGANPLGNITSQNTSGVPNTHGPSTNNAMILDLSASATGPGNSYDLLALLLRVDNSFHPLLIRGREPNNQLENIAIGGYESLIIPDSLGLLEPDEQSSLVYVFCLRETLETWVEGCFWTSVPIFRFLPNGHSG